MAVTLQADPTLADFNAYATRAFVTSFLIEKRLFASTWDAVANKDAAIMWATRELDRLNYAGTRATSSNRHEWPRTSVPDVASDEIPIQLQEATAELSFYLGQVDRSQPDDQEKFESLKVGPITLAFREAATGRELTSEMPDSVRGLVRRFLAGGTVGTINRKAVRV